MRLLFITQDFLPETGGIENYSLEISKRISKSTELFLLVAPEKPGSERVDRSLPFKVRRVGISNTLLFLPLIFLVPFWVKKYRFDISFHSQWQTALGAIIAKKIGLLQYIAVASHARELLFNPLGKGLSGQLYIKYQKWVLKNIDVFYPVSDYTATLLKKNDVEENRIQVVINGTDPNQFYPKNVESLKKELGLINNKVLLTVTRLVSRKGVDTVIEALPDIIKNIPEVHYLIGGEGTYRSGLELLVKNKQLEQNVTFLGKIPVDMLNDYYNLCDIFVMPSKTVVPDVEGFGIVFLEANACAKPVIGSNSGGIPSAVIHNETGVIVNENSPDELSAAVIDLLKDTSKAEKMGQNGLKRIHEEANWNTTADKIVSDIKTRFEQ